MIVVDVDIVTFSLPWSQHKSLSPWLMFMLWKSGSSRGRKSVVVMIRFSSAPRGKIIYPPNIHKVHKAVNAGADDAAIIYGYSLVNSKYIQVLFC